MPTRFNAPTRYLQTKAGSLKPTVCISFWLKVKVPRMEHQNPIAFDNTYAQLPGRFFSHQRPTKVQHPALIRVNTSLATQLNIDPDWLSGPEGIAMVAGNQLPEGSEPISAVYAGHQFGNWNPQLGDGRAVLLGEVMSREKLRYDIQLKGSGPTPYSRGGDGRAPLGPVLREYILSEAMFALGIPSTRTLAAVTTGEEVYREEPLPGGVLARIAGSHIRIGTFQYFASLQDNEALKLLADHVIARHFPEISAAPNPYLALLNSAVARQASLIASWQLVGFIHGVMNTDNALLCGETIDYGPCAFLDRYDPAAVFSSIDSGGRYAYQNQPGIAHWNLMCLAQSLLPLFADDQEVALKHAQEAIDTFPELFWAAYDEGMNRKLGLNRLQSGDRELGQELLTLMAAEQLDFTLTFRFLSASDSIADDRHANDENHTSLANLISLPASLSPWLARWQARQLEESTNPDERRTLMQHANPLYIARNHRVEEAIAAAVILKDLAPFNTLVDVLARPFDFQSTHLKYAEPPGPDQIVRRTFCGT